MLISSDRGGGQIVSPSDDTRFYDDVACLAADWSAHHRNTRAYVRVSAGWKDTAEAWFARPAGAATPMGSGIEAFATANEAREADRAGRALTFDDVIRIAGERR